MSKRSFSSIYSYTLQRRLFTHPDLGFLHVAMAMWQRLSKMDSTSWSTSMFGWVGKVLPNLDLLHEAKAMWKSKQGRHLEAFPAFEVISKCFYENRFEKKIFQALFIGAVKPVHIKQTSVATKVGHPVMEVFQSNAYDSSVFVQMVTFSKSGLWYPVRSTQSCLYLVYTGIVHLPQTKSITRINYRGQFNK